MTHMDPEEKLNTEEEKTAQQEGADEVSALKNEVAALNDKYLRLFAEFDNYKRRTATERIELMKTASKEVILSLLPVLDDMERALKNINEASDVNALKEGVTLIQNKLYNALSSKGLKPIEALGSEFDVELHEAVTKFPVDDASKKGKVIDELEKGYTLHDKIIRYSKVVIGE